MESFYDFIVVGSGPAGLNAALTASKAGKQVALIEKNTHVGGSYIRNSAHNAKRLREAARVFNFLRKNSDIFDYSLRSDFELSKLVESMNEGLQQYSKSLLHELTSRKVEVLNGHAKLRDPQTVSVQYVDGRIHFLEAENILIATGSLPTGLPGIEVDHENILDRDSILSLLYLPKSLSVVGSGVTACEFASLFASLGVNVTMITSPSEPLSFLDPDLRKAFLSTFVENGGCFIGNDSVLTAVWNGKDAVELKTRSGRFVKSEKLFLASDGKPNTTGLGIENVGIQMDENGFIKIDSNFETSIPGLFAAGEVTGSLPIISLNQHNGIQASIRALGSKSIKSSAFFPLAIHTLPEIATTGIDLLAARSVYSNDSVSEGSAKFHSNAQGIDPSIPNGWIKMIARNDNSQLLGVQMIGDGAIEYIHTAVTALRNGNKLNDMIDQIYDSQNITGCYREAALDLLEKIRSNLP